jgi:hypothetical protein
MTREQTKQTREILAALVKQNKYATLTAAARIVLAEAARETDQVVKGRLLVMAGKIQALESNEGTF